MSKPGFTPETLSVRIVPESIGFSAAVVDRETGARIMACTHQHGRNSGTIAGKELARVCGERMARRMRRRATLAKADGQGEES